MLATTTPNVRTDAYAQELINKLPRTRSLTSHIAQDLVCEMPVAKVARLIATIRRCSRLTNSWRRTELTGGLELSIQLPMPTYDVGHQYMRSYLKPGWNRSKIIVAFRKLWLKAETEIKLMRLREEVYALANEATPAPIGDLTDKFNDEVDAAADGHTLCYRDMNEADCDHWKKWFQGRNKTPLAA